LRDHENVEDFVHQRENSKSAIWQAGLPQMTC
jgi:hypothetical protein